MVTAPNASVAKTVARALVEKRLAACANVVPDLLSVYWWDDAVQESAEVLILLKARKDDVAAIAERVQELHPYEVPEVIATDVIGGLASYLDWVSAETQRR